MATNGVPPVEALACREFTLRYDDGPAIDYRVKDAETLSWRMAGGAWTEARYQAWESMPGVILFGHLLDGMPNHDGHMIVADFDAGLATCFNGTLKGPYFANEACARTLFGVVVGQGVPAPGTLRHQRTREMLGRALTWNYAPGLTSMHLYSTPQTVSWIIFTDSGAGGMAWSGPGDFVKIRDGLYFCYWLEDACNGTLGTILINMRTMHDAGIGYHCGMEGLSMSQIGAHGRHAGKYDVTRFFAGREG
nr:MoaF N-terminal domain-containing protein [Sphingobium nicotianae]